MIVSVLFVLQFATLALSSVTIIKHGNLTEGSTLLLECQIETFENFAEWNGGLENTVSCLNNGFCGIFSDSNYNIYANMTGMFLTIQKLRIPTDERTWKCTYNAFNQSVKVDIKIPVAIQRLTPNGTINLTEGIETQFNCSVRSRPSANITWSIGEKLLKETSSSNLPNYVAESTVNYKANKSDTRKRLVCSAKNEASIDRKEVILNIRYLPIVTIIPDYSPYSIIENTTDLNLTCCVNDTNPEVKSYRWYHDGSEIPDAANGSFIFPKVMRSHSGSYKCDATNEVGSSNKSSLLQLNILYGVFVTISNETQFFEGNNLSLTCFGQSNPDLTDDDVLWTKKNNQNFRRTGKQLIIDNVNRNEKGTFICTVVIALYPSIGQPTTVSGSAQTEIDILYRPSVDIKSFSNPLNVIENTTDVQLECYVINAHPAATSYSWRRNGSVIPNETHATYHISNVLKKHAGNYTCSASNTAGISELSSIFQLNVLYGVSMNALTNQQQVEGTELFVRCSGQSNPAIKTNDVTWTKKNNVSFSRTGPELHINNLNRHDSGTYICTVVVMLLPSDGLAMNVSGTESMTIDVFYTPVIILENASIVIWEGQNLSTSCKVNGNPPPTAQWWRQNVSLTSESKNLSTLTIAEISRSDAGNYTCIAKSELTSERLNASAHIGIDVHYAPDVEIFQDGDLPKEEFNLTLTCNTSGIPSSYWYGEWTHVFDNKTIRVLQGSGRNLYLYNLSYRDTGTYICNVTNGVFDRDHNLYQKAEKNIQVYFKPKFIIKKQRLTAKLGSNVTVAVGIFSFPDIEITVEWRNVTDGNNSLISNGTQIFMSLQTSPVYALFYNTTVEVRNNSYEASLHFIDFTSSLAGFYSLTVRNSIEANSVKMQVILSDVPSPPTDFRAIMIGSTVITLSWTAGFNGGNKQTFTVVYKKKESDDKKYVITKEEDGSNNKYEVNIENLEPSVTYLLYINASNTEGWADAINNSVEVTTVSLPENKESSIIGPIGGAIGGTFVAVFIAVMIGLFLRRYNSTKGKQPDSLLLANKGESNKDDENGLKDNILYESAGPQFKTQQSAYSVVKKGSMKQDISNDGLKETALYAEVNNKTRVARDNVIQKRNSGNLYSIKDDQKDEIYQNDPQNEQNTGVQNRIKNKDGLVYADLVFFDNGSKDRTFIIHGLENKTCYADIDLNAKAEQEFSEEKDNKNKNI